MMSVRIVVLSLLMSWGLWGQNPDRILSLEQFTDIVQENHPVFYQSELLIDQAEGNLLMAKGGFDPKFDGSFGGKLFDEKNYYRLITTGVKIPTWIGLDVKAGYEQSSGIFLDDSDNLPDRGLVYAGLSMPLGKGLFIDQRRAELQKARIFVQSNAQAQIRLKNELLFEAINAYLQWQMSYQNLQVAREGVQLAEQRFQAARSSFINGDKPAIDTLESLISVQNRNIELQKIEQELLKDVFTINTFLWLEGRVPLELDENTFPESPLSYFNTQVDSLYLVQEVLLQQHPELLDYEYKLSELNVDRRLALESLKPEVNVNYNPLYEAGDRFLPGNNFKYGITAAYPLFIRKERGKLNLTNVKIRDTEYDFALKTNQITNKLETFFRLQDQIQTQNVVIESTVDNYLRMVAAENRRFEIGESSIFLINSREIKYLESRYKLIEGRNKLLRTRLNYLLYTGQLASVL